MRNFPGFGQWISRRAERTPHRVALVFEDTSWTYSQLDAACARVAAGLSAHGVGRGDRVAYVGVNHPAFVAVLFGCARLGAVMTPINWRLTGPEIAFIVEDSGAVCLIHDAALAPAVDSVANDLSCRTIVANDLEVDYLLPRLGGQDGMALPPVDTAGTDLALLMYTSGTQGRPKGAMITGDNLVASILSHDCTYDLGPDHVALVAAPLFHIGGINVNFLNTFLKGGTVVLERGFDPARILELVPVHRINSFFAASVMLEMLAAQPEFDDSDLSTIGWIYCGGAPVNENIVHLYARRGIPVCNGYGMTEATPVISTMSPDEAVDRIGSSGRPSFFVDVRIAGESGAEQPAGQRGEILIKGPNVIAGYWNQPEATSHAVRDGWLHTGDVGIMTPDGYLYVVDRLKDMIISGGENVSSAEVERCLLEHPDVADTAVIGRPHDKWGEVPLAFVVLRAGSTVDEDQLRRHVSARLARFKQPHTYAFVPDLPRNASGKLLKNELRRSAVAEHASSPRA